MKDRNNGPAISSAAEAELCWIPPVRPAPRASASASAAARNITVKILSANLRYALYRALRVCLSAGAVILLLAISIHLRHVNTTTVTLVLVLIVLGIGVKWGALEALIAAIIASFGLDYFFLNPKGFGIEAPEHWVALFTFLATAVVTSQLSARANRLRAEAIQRREEIEKAYQVADAISEGGNADDIVQRLGSALMKISGLEAVAVCEAGARPVFRLGIRSERIEDGRLSEVASSGTAFLNPKSGVSIEPILAAGEVWGSLGVAGAGVSAPLLKAIAEKAGAAIWKARAAERETELAIARRSDELKTAIFDALAHEARGPLSSIKLASTTLLSQQPGNQTQQRELLTIIREEVDRVNRWIEEATQVSQATARQLTLHKAPRDLGGLVSSVFQELGPAVEGRRVGVEIAESLPLADCDAGMIRRVLHLLLDNALKYSPAGSPIAVSVGLDYDMDMLVVGVADAGPGVPEDEKARIFEKHYRGAQHRSRVPGTGLGLASAKCMVEAQGGAIWVTNRPLGGAVFHFSLPVAAGATA